MKWIGKIILLYVVLNSCESANKKITFNSNYSIIPKPQQLSITEGFFEISEKTCFYYDSSESKVVEFLTNYLEENFKIKGKNKTSNQNATNKIYFLKIDGVLGKIDDYQISINSNSIVVHASSEAGLFYAVQSIIQLAELNNSTSSKSLLIPNCTIKDWAFFKHRGMLLDCCRHFFDTSTIKKYLKLMSYYKMNVLHWHLTEDQGWRIAIDNYPKLTSIGAFRKDSTGNYGDFYSKDEIRDIVSFAKELHINIIPEIELPGHSQAAIAAYPHLSCTNEKFDVANDWGVFKEIYCAGNDSVFVFLENVFSEIVELFPYEYIHIGGDEAPKFRWENCLKCQQRIKNEALEDEHELQSYFIKRINTFLESKNRSIIGWDEIIEGGLPKNATVQSWRGMNGGEKAVKMGNKAIMSPTSHAYFDYSIKTTDLKKVYSFDPVPKGLSNEEKKLVLGGECNVWSEHIPNEKELDRKVFPRLLAMSEVLWTYDSNRSYKNFKERINHHYPILTEKKINYGIEGVPCTIGVSKKSDALNIELIKGDSELTLKYKWRNSSNKFAKFTDSTSITIESDSLIVQAYKNNSIYGEPVTQHFKKHKGIAAGVCYLNDYHSSYKGNCELNLVDGKLGSADFRDGCWQGFWKENLNCIIDLQKIKTIQQISARFLQYTNSWIFFPKEVTIQTSKDAINWENWGVIKNKKNNYLRGKNIQLYTLCGAKLSIRYIKVIASNIGIVPKWHEAAGSGAWLFADEIIIK